MAKEAQHATRRRELTISVIDGVSDASPPLIVALNGVFTCLQQVQLHMNYISALSFHDAKVSGAARLLPV